MDRDDIFRRAQQGDASAALQVAGWYRKGVGVPRDAAKAVYWYERAGPPNGWGLLGFMYLEGDDVPRDIERAAAYFRGAAETGEPLSMYQLGALHADAAVQPHDPVEGYMWLVLAQKMATSRPGCARQVECRAWAIKDRPGYRERLNSTPTSEEKAEADRRVAAWLASRPALRR